jgi:hypothetical protein
VARGTEVERAKGLVPEAARKAAIKNLSANIHHYDAKSSHFPPGINLA